MLLKGYETVASMRLQFVVSERGMRRLLQCDSMCRSDQLSVGVDCMCCLVEIKLDR